MDLHQLMPEKAVMDELKRLRQAHSDFLVQKQDMEATIEEFKGQILTDLQKGAMSQEEIDEHEAQKQENIKGVEDHLKEQTQNDKECQARIKELLGKAKRSIDDERDPSHFKDSIYKKDFINDNQIKNQINSIVSAMVSQISAENTHNESHFTGNEDDTQEETLDDLFESYSKEIAQDNRLIDREDE